MNHRYDYRCPNCGYEEELRHSRDEDWSGDLPCFLCSEYGNPSMMVKVPYAAPAIYRAGGFYSVDHRKGGTE